MWVLCNVQAEMLTDIINQWLFNIRINNKSKKIILDLPDLTMAVEMRENDALYQRGYNRDYESKQI